MFRLQRIKLTQFIHSKKKFSTDNSAAPKLYSKGLRVVHFIQAFCFTGACIFGYIAARIDPKKASPEELKKKKTLMHLHKSFGLLMFGFITPRLVYRLSTAVPAHLPATSLELMANKLTHLTLNVFIVALPTTGVLMGYYSGYGVPFFKWHVNGAPKSKADTPKFKNRSGLFYKLHTQMGRILEYVLPLHIAGAAFPFLVRGQNVMRRMNPFK